MLNQFIKDPDAVLDYEIDWTQWLQAGEKIVTSTWIVDTGITQTAASGTDTTSTIWLADGVVNTTYKVTNRVTTNVNRTDDRTIRIRVAQR